MQKLTVEFWMSQMVRIKISPMRLDRTAVICDLYHCMLGRHFWRVVPNEDENAIEMVSRQLNFGGRKQQITLGWSVWSKLISSGRLADEIGPIRPHLRPTDLSAYRPAWFCRPKNDRRPVELILCRIQSVSIHQSTAVFHKISSFPGYFHCCLVHPCVVQRCW